MFFRPEFHTPQQSRTGLSAKFTAAWKPPKLGRFEAKVPPFIACFASVFSTVLTMSPMTTHDGCSWDYPREVVLAFGEVRGLKLALASVQDDDAASSAVLDEIGDCVECLRCMARFLAGMAGSIGVALAENAGADEQAVVRQLEMQLAEAIAKLP
ncbi:hypothetical protein [Mycobacterium shottsii]|nr:hypothetical protein [Mycobacterium shottsii]